MKGINYADKKEIPRVWDDLGYAYFKKGKIEQAIAYLKKAKSVRPENFNVYLYLTAAYILNNEFEKASQELKKIEKHIYFDESWLDMISDAKLRGADGKIMSIYEVQRLEKEKGIYIYKMTQGELFSPLIVVEIDAFDEKNEGLLYYVQGIVYKWSEEFDTAEKKLIDALEAGYDEKEVRVQLRDLYLKTDRINKAEEQLSRLKEISPKSWDSHKIGFHIHHRLKGHVNNLVTPYHEQFLKELEKGKLTESIKILEKAQDINEETFIVNHNLALLYFDLGGLEKAEIYCARALWFKKDHLGCHDLMGNIYFHQGEKGRALNEFDKMLKLDEWNAHAHYNLGSIYYDSGDQLKAEKHWQKAIECEQKKLKVDKENFSAEKELEYSLTVRKRPIFFLAHKSLGKLYYEQDLTEKAVAEFIKAIQLQPNESESYLDLAKAYTTTKEIKKAIGCLEKYIYLGGKRETEARKLLSELKRKK